MCVAAKSPKWWFKTRIFTFCVAFHIFIADNCRRFKFGMWVEHRSPSLRMTTLKGAWSLPHDLFNFWKISDNILKTVQDSLIVSDSFRMTYHQQKGRGYGHVIVLKFCRLS